ncbi:hypothetical protein D3C72_613840 [compost metagenome]
MHEALHRQVTARGLQVLAEGQHVDVVLAHTQHDLDDFLVGFAQAQHQAGFGRYVGHRELELLQQVQRPLEVRTGARGLVQARHGFQVVVEHIRRLSGGDRQGHVHASAIVRHQGLQLHAGGQLADLAQAIDKVLGAAVAQIVAIHRGDHHVLQAQLGDGHGQVHRLVDVQRPGPAMADIAERTAPGADVAHDHEGRGATGKTLAEVRARGFFADTVQLVLAQQLLDPVDLGRDRHAHANPVGFAREFIRGNDLHRNPRDLVRAAQFGADFYFRRALAGRCDNGIHGAFLVQLRRSCGSGLAREGGVSVNIDVD